MKYLDGMSGLSAIVFLGLLPAGLPAQEQLKPQVARTATADGGFTPLFNGKNLDGWVNVNCHPSTFYVKDGEIVTTGKPTGFLRSVKQYENFVLEMDWMHVNKKDVANSGLFVWGDPLPAVGTPYTRGIEVQVLINYPKVDWATNHGDIFSIHGARCKPDRPHPKGYERCLPSEERVKGAGEWNHYKVTANNGAIKLEVNGKEVSGVSQCNPRKGYLALESEGAECHFKNIVIKELPSTNPKPEECAKVAEGFKSLFNGLDLKGWKTQEVAWKASGGILRCSGKEDLLTEAKYGHFELVFDWKLPAKSKDQKCIVLAGAQHIFEPPAKTKPGMWTRGTLKFNRGTLEILVEGCKRAEGTWMQVIYSANIGFAPAEGLEIMNVFVRELKEKK